MNETIFDSKDKKDSKQYFEKGSEKSGKSNGGGSGRRPVFANSNVGAAAWINKSGNTGDFYIRVQVPLLDGFNLYVPSEFQGLFNEFAEELFTRRGDQ